MSYLFCMHQVAKLKILVADVLSQSIVPQSTLTQRLSPSDVLLHDRQIR